MSFEPQWGYSTGINDLVNPTVRSSAVGVTVVHFGDVTAACEQFIRQSDQIVGAVAWVRSPRLIRALAERPVALIVNKEFALRQQHSKERLALRPLRGGVRRYSLSKAPVRVIGDCSRGSFTGLMHHKFLIRLDRGRPVAVWTGSFNLTTGAAGNLENAVEIHDKAVAREFFHEFERLWDVAEPIDFKRGAPAGIRSAARPRKREGTLAVVKQSERKQPPVKRKHVAARRTAA